ncbi:MAG: hypothetical protein K9G26_02950 [Emcibacter sp.]|nr:hypothetical protein [Emcibacter sp.]
MERQLRAEDINFSQALAQEQEKDIRVIKEDKINSFKIGKFIWNMMPFLFAFVTLSALFVGFRLREYAYFTAEKGVGYALGIIGGCMMLALLLYPLRKRYRILSIMGDVRAWFSLHMVLGIVGPVLILFHSNFDLGSTNSNVALFSMLIVSISGVVGRYIYTKIHHGLYGQKIELGQLKNKLHDNQSELTALLHFNPEIRDELFAFVDHVLSPPKGILHSWGRVMSVGIGSRRLIARTRKNIQTGLMEKAQSEQYSKKEIKAKVRKIIKEVRVFLDGACKVVELTFYERMFALWHVLHLPLFFMLVIAAIVHVIAVHWY